MSLTISEPQAAKFLDRFEHVRTSLRRSQVLLGLGWTALAATLGFAELVALDYRFELPRVARAWGLGSVAALALAVFVMKVVAPIRWWSRPRAAAEIEHRFPQLGQRIRTVVQYGTLSDDRMDEEGVAANLVGALEEETEVQSRPLRLDRVVPRRRVRAVAAAAVLPALAVVVAALADGEWRTALGRTLLGRSSYTTLAVAPGNTRIDQGEDVAFAVELKGRPRREVILYTRPADKPGAPWTSTPMLPKDGAKADDGSAPRVAKLEKVREPLAYRVVAGPAGSPTYRVAVRYPLAVKTFEVDLRPPSYTGVAPGTVKGGDLQAIEGTVATFRVAFDAPPAEASLVFTDPYARPKKGEPEPKPLVLPLKPEGPAHVAGLTLAKGGYYRIEARTADGRLLPKNRYRLDVHEDRAPRVSFEEPDEALEVHPIAEVRNRVRVGDDFGLTRAGIVFRFNDGEEQTLLLKDFAPGPDGKSTAAATLEAMLLMETLKATSTDSVTYFAFAEDNYPGGAKRTETDLRYLDIRPFKREYKIAEGMGDGDSGESTSLQELIARQRFNLNRAVRLAHRRPNDKTPPEDPLRIATFEESLVGLVREFTEGLEGIAGQRVEPLHQAEEAMLAAIDALDRGQNAEPTLRMAEALRHLIEVRQTFRILIANGGAQAKAARSFDRLQAQKIRKPKSKDEEAEALGEELEKLAKEEDFVYATLAGIIMESDSTKSGNGSSQASGSPETAQDEKDKDAQAKDAAEKDAQAKDAAEKGGQAKNAASKSESGKGQSKGQGGEGGQGPENGPGSGNKPDDASRSGEGDEDSAGRDGAESRKQARRDALERQEKIADEARALEERLKRLEEASDLAKARMEKAAEAAEKAAGALARGNTEEGTKTARAGALLLHEVARQVKGEIAREVADELAMARDLADELARREDEFGQMNDGPQSPGSNGGRGEPDRKEQKGQAGKGQKGEKSSPGSGPGTGDLWGDWSNLSDAERLSRLEEAAKTMEEWLKGASRTEGAAGDQIRELMRQGPATQVVERTGRIKSLYQDGQRSEARREARDLAKMLEMLSAQLDVLHRGVVAPALAKLVEFDRRVAELTARMKTRKTEAEVAEWYRQAAALVRDLEKAGLVDAAEALNRTLEAAGGRTAVWRWAEGGGGLLAPEVYTNGLSTVAFRIQERLQELVLKDLGSDRDEATPPEFRELVERYYEVLSVEGGGKAQP